MNRARLCIIITQAVLGIAAGIVVLFAADMLLLSGHHIAGHFVGYQDACGLACHGGGK